MKIRPPFEGKRGTQTILGNREHQKTNIDGRGGRGTRPFISGEQGNRYPHHFGRASRMYRLLNTPNHNKYSICFKIKARRKTEARMPGLQHHMGLDARNHREQQ